MRDKKTFKSVGKAIVLAGFTVGTLDALAAVILYYISTGKNPVVVFNFIASGVFGNKAFYGGLTTALAGLIFHFIIAYLFTILLFFQYPILIRVFKKKLIIGALYGIFIWLIMNLLVLPSSNVPQTPPDFLQAVINCIILIICVGIPLSLFCNKYYNRA